MKGPLCRRLAIGVAACALCVAGALAHAQASTSASVRLHFSPPRFQQVQLSPSGERLAAIAPVNGRQGLVVMDVADRKPRVVASIANFDVGWFAWVNDARLVASFADRQATPSTFSGTGLFAVDHDGQNLRELATDRRTYRIVRMLSLRDDGSDDVLIVAQDIRVPSQWKRRYPDAFRLNTRSGEASLLTEDRPGDPIHWVADRAGAWCAPR